MLYANRYKDNYQPEVMTRWSMAVFSVLMAFGFLFLLHCDGSPLYGLLFTGDAACFHVMGKSWMMGYVPYIDYFDHKGPLLFLLYGLGFLIDSHGRWGVFVIEVLAVAWTLWMLLDIAHMMRTPRVAIIVSVIAFLSYIFAFTQSPACEIFSLPWQALPLWVFSRCLVRSEGCPRLVDSLCYGIAIGALAMIRLNNACVNIGVLVVMGGMYIRHRELKGLFANMLVVIIGVIIFILPFVVYFWIVSGMDDFIYATFTFNFLYRFSHHYNMAIVRNLYVLLPILVLSVMACVYTMLDKDFSTLGVVCLVSTIIMCIAYCNGACYGHYFLVLAPVLFVDLIILLRQKSVLIWVISLGLLCIPIAQRGYNALTYTLYHSVGLNNSWVYSKIGHWYPDPRVREAALSKIIAKIPPSEWGEVYLDDALDALPLFQITGTLPSNRYFNVPTNLISTDPSLRGAITGAFYTTAPKWVITTKPSECISKILYNEYTVIESTQSPNLYVYHRK